MNVRQRALRIGALSAILFSGGAMVLNGSAFAASTPPAPKPHQGHVHIEDHVHVEHGKDIKLRDVCAVALRPHTYRGYDETKAVFTVTAVGSHETPTKLPVDIEINNATTASNTWTGFTPVIAHLDDIATLAAPKGNYHVDKNGKVHDDRRWKVTLTVTDFLGRKFKKDIDVRGCNPTTVHNDPTADPANDLPDDDQAVTDNTTTTTVPGATTSTTVIDEGDATVCLPAGQMFGYVLGVVNGSVRAGGAVGVPYTGASALNPNQVFMTVDGVDVDVTISGNNLYYLTPQNFASGQHTAKVSVRNVDGDCGEMTFNFKSNQGSSGTT